MMSTVTEQELITRAVLDYMEGWFDGDPARMERAVHRDLVKRRPGEDRPSRSGSRLRSGWSS